MWKTKTTDQAKPACCQAETSCCQADQPRMGHNLRLTPLRRMVLDYLQQAQEPVKAYDILDALRGKSSKALTPASVYRTLEFLLNQGLVHKVGSLNAFVACAETCHKKHAPVFMLVCPGCRKSREVNNPALYQTIFSTMQQQGFQLQGDTVELTGICPRCAEMGAQAGS